MSTKQELIEIHEARIEKETNRLQLKRDLIDALPPGLDYNDVHAHGYKADGTITFRVQGLDDLLTHVEALPPLPLMRYKDSCLSYVPEDSLTEEDLDKAQEAWVIQPLVFDFDFNSVKLKWFTQIGEFRFSVSFEVIEGRSYAKTYINKIKDDRGRVTGVEKCLDSFFHDVEMGLEPSIDTFWSQDDRVHKQIYFHICGDETIYDIVKAFPSLEEVKGLKLRRMH